MKNKIATAVATVCVLISVYAILYEGTWEMSRGADATTASVLINGGTITFERCSGFFESWEGKKHAIMTNALQNRVYIVHRGEEIEINSLQLAQGHRLHLRVLSEVDSSWHGFSDSEKGSIWSAMSDESVLDGQFLFAPPTSAGGSSTN